MTGTPLTTTATYDAIKAVASVSIPVQAVESDDHVQLQVGNLSSSSIAKIRSLLDDDGWDHAWAQDAHTARGGIATVILVGNKGLDY